MIPVGVVKLQSKVKPLERRHRPHTSVHELYRNTQKACMKAKR